MELSIRPALGENSSLDTSSQKSFELRDGAMVHQTVVVNLIRICAILQCCIGIWQYELDVMQVAV